MLLAGLVVLGLAVRDGVAARSRLATVQGDNLLASIRQPDADLGRLRATAHRDAVAAQRASLLLHRWPARLVADIPVLGNTWRSERAVADVAATALTGVDRSGAYLGRLGTAGEIDVRSVAALGAAMADTAHRLKPELARLDGAPTGMIPGSLRSIVVESRRQLQGVDDDLSRAANGVAAVAALLGAHGPQHLLLVLENNAELRATGGLISSYALIDTNDGHLQISAVHDVGQVAQPPLQAVAVASPPGFAVHYGQFLANTTLWKNSNMSPDTPESAEVLANVAKVSTGQRPDAVVFLDVRALATISAASHSVQLPDGEQADGDRLMRYLLVDAYRTNDEAARRHELQSAATAAVSSLVHAPLDVPLASALLSAARGRHLLLWSADASVQRQLSASGLAGSVDPHGTDLVLVSAHNLGDPAAHIGDKLDYYVYRSVDLSATIGTHAADVTQRITMVNRAPSGLPPYVAGRSHPGTLHELVTVALPVGATVHGLTVDGRPATATQWTEAASDRYSVNVDLAPDESATIVLSYRAPISGGNYRTTLFPQPLVHDASLRARLCAAPGGVIDRRSSGLDQAGQCATYDGWMAHTQQWQVVVGPKP